MIRLLFLLLAGCVVDETPEPAPPLAEPTSILDDVDVFTGTSSLGFGVGSAFPGPALPFGMARPGPDTRGESSTLWSLHCSGYRWSDPWIAGFSSMRLHGTGIPDYGAVALQPATNWDEPLRRQVDYKLRKDFDSEVASPGRYGVNLETDAGPVEVELTATARTGHHVYTFPPAQDAGLILDISHVLPDMSFSEGELTANADGTQWQGWLHFDGAYSGRHGGETVYFVVRFDLAPIDTEVWTPDDNEDGALGAFLAFDLVDGGEVQAQVALSFVDLEGAQANLDAEQPGFDFEGTAAAARQAWDDAFSSLAIAGGDEVARANYASSAYHSMLMPTLFTDVDGRYQGFDGAAHEAVGWTYYTDFSLWDTYRTLHPLMNLIDPDRQADFVRSLLAMGEQGGRLPRWPLGTGYTGGMLGDPAFTTISGALLRGIGDVDAGAALEQMLDTASQRHRWVEWEAQGWLSVDGGGSSVAETLEYAWADHATANLAAHLGDPREPAIRARSEGWRNLFDDESGFLRPRAADGTWLTPFEPLDSHDAYVEGNAWHYTFMAPQDAQALIDLFGRERFVERLERFFYQATLDPVFTFPSLYYWHGNEPSIHASYLFALAGRPDLTRRWARWVEDNRYYPGPEGLSGNDDAGTLAAWYVFSAAGLYPIAGTTTYVLGVPRFEAVRTRIGDGWLMTRAPGLEDAADPTAVARITVNGVEWTEPTLDWSDISGGAEIVFELE